MVAKGKSMVSEEAQLNVHLEAAGIEVVETDLGEYIIQMELTNLLTGMAKFHPLVELILKLHQRHPAEECPAPGRWIFW